MQDGFSERLRNLRRRKGLRQSDLGKLVELHYNHIGRYERGESQPTADALKRLAKVLDVSIDYLVDGITEESTPTVKLKDPKLFEQFQEIEDLAERDRALVKEFLDAFLTKKKLEALVASR